MEPLFSARQILKRLSSNYNTLASKHSSLMGTQSTISFLKTNLNKIDTRLSELSLYLGKNIRSKREILDGLGTVLKWLIGTPDAKDAKRYDECINALEKREIKITSLMSQQLQIVSSTVDNFNRTINKLSYDEEIMNNNIIRLNNYFNSTSQLLSDIKATEEISSISIQILEIVMSLEQEIDDVLLSILFVKSGAIHPSIISTEKLYHELLISSHTRVDKKLVASITTNNIHEILESTTLTSYVYMNRLTYILEFPLVRNNHFKLYHIYSIPFQHPNFQIHSIIIPEHKYLAISPNQQQYIILDSLSSCKSYAAEKMVCDNMAVYNVASRRICEIEILLSTERDIPNTCNVNTLAAEINIFQPIRHNKWIYVLTKETPCILQCKEESKHYVLQGAGIATLEPNCKLFSEVLTLTASDSETKNVSYPIMIPDITLDDCCKESTEIQTPQLIPMKLNHISLDSLKATKATIENFSEQLKQLQSTSFIERNRTNISWLSIVFGLAMALYIVYKCCQRYPLLSFMRRRNRDHQSGCINIFNNCFDNSRRQHRSSVIPMTTIPNIPVCISEDETSTEEGANPTTTKIGQESAQSLF